MVARRPLREPDGLRGSHWDMAPSRLAGPIGCTRDAGTYCMVYFQSDFRLGCDTAVLKQRGAPVAPLCLAPEERPVRRLPPGRLEVYIRPHTRLSEVCYAVPSTGSKSAER